MNKACDTYLHSVGALTDFHTPPYLYLYLKKCYGSNKMRHMNKACDTPLLSRGFGSLPHSSRILFVDEDGNFSEVSKDEECNGSNEPYLVVTSVSTGD